jgi:hypothetical protein
MVVWNWIMIESLGLLWFFFLYVVISLGIKIMYVLLLPTNLLGD